MFFVGFGPKSIQKRGFGSCYFWAVA